MTLKVYFFKNYLLGLTSKIGINNSNVIYKNSKFEGETTGRLDIMYLFMYDKIT